MGLSDGVITGSVGTGAGEGLCGIYVCKPFIGSTVGHMVAGTKQCLKGSRG